MAAGAVMIARHGFVCAQGLHHFAAQGLDEALVDAQGRHAAIDMHAIFGSEVGVVILTGYHHFLARRFKQLQRGEPIGSEKFWRMINELPIVLALIMVLSVTLEWGSHG